MATLSILCFAATLSTLLQAVRVIILKYNNYTDLDFESIGTIRRI